jgi:minimal PKS chain-length factor (CLF/KS beta)
MTKRRAVITGIGIIAPSGSSADAHWKTVMSGESKIGTITRFDPDPPGRRGDRIRPG